MFKKLGLRIFSAVLLCCMLIAICPAKAASEYTLEIEGEPIFSELLPYSEGNEIMVPLYATTEALGGINLNAPIGDAHRAAILNDRALYIITGSGGRVKSGTGDFSPAGEVFCPASPAAGPPPKITEIRKKALHTGCYLL